MHGFRERVVEICREYGVEAHADRTAVIARVLTDRPITPDEVLKYDDPTAAGQDVALKRTGPHLVLTGLAKPLAPYDSFLMTLIFERAGEIEVEIAVEEGAGPATQ